MIRWPSNHYHRLAGYLRTMADTPDIAGVAALIGDRARAQMLVTLMGGQALTATELAGAANVTKPTASAHLRKLLGARLIGVAAQGRHRYYRLADHDVADLLERLIGLADGRAPTRPLGPRDPLLRKARVCYDHIAGELGVLAHDSLTRRKLMRVGDDGTELSDGGVDFFGALGIDVAALGARHRPLCRACLDWSERRYHLGGSVGAALLRHCIDRGWARRARSSRSLLFSAPGERAFRRHFPVR
jgi:DNA-binding transcriptional ArsR family regulator